MPNELRSLTESFIDKASKLRVAVVGETILDEFVEVVYEGHSMKSFCPVFRFAEGKEKTVQQGGAAAIAGHLRDFVKEVNLISNKNGEIVKTRFMDASDKKKHVEVNRFERAGFGPVKIDTRDYDIVIVADFGHGFCDQLQVNDGFHLMCQTNSNNFGFNRMSKWKKQRKKSVTLDIREASLQMNRSISGYSDEDIGELFAYELNTEHLFVTLGSAGSLYSNGKKIVRQFSYKSQIVDTIGAGDTFYSFCCLLPSIQPDVSDLRIPALAASLSTTWLCNEKSVTRESLLNYADRFVQ
ncbi:MAG TPA: PfkB family carbohydrate kinase [Bacteroidia bacterium]|nr:PfkB family carbohydrate kinase [Bacteroidia bacterium]